MFSKTLPYLLAPLLAGGAALSHAGILTNAKVMDNNRIVFQLTSPFQYHAFFLSNPDRCIIDFKQTDLEHALNKTALGKLPVNAIRTSISTDMTLRVVLDLKGKEHPTFKMLPPSKYGSWRFMVEFHPTATASTAKSVPTSNAPPISDIQPIPNVQPAPTAKPTPIPQPVPAVIVTPVKTAIIPVSSLHPQKPLPIHSTQPHAPAPHASYLKTVETTPRSEWGDARVASLVSGEMIDNNRMILDLTAPSQYHAFFLSNPERCVIDFQKTDLERPLNKMALGKSPVKSVRTSINANMTLRVVLDLKGKRHPVLKMLPPSQYGSWRFLVDFRSTTTASSFDSLPMTSPQPVSSTQSIPSESVSTIEPVSNSESILVPAPEPTPAPKPAPSAPQPIPPAQPVMIASSRFDTPIVDRTSPSHEPLPKNVDSVPDHNPMNLPPSAPSPFIPPEVETSSTLGWGRAQGTAAGATRSVGIVGGDVMVPVYGNQEQFVYADMMGDYANDKTYLASPGAGLRKVYGNQVVGAYFFGDYEKTSSGENFWNLSPGVEWFNPEWDAHVNGYFPTTNSKATGSAAFASDQGNYDYVTFQTGTHNQYDQITTPAIAIGNGVDTELGYSFDMLRNNLRSRAYVGSYYYQAPSDTTIDNITGVTAGFSQALTPYATVSIFNSYDQVSNYNVGLGVSFTWGGESNQFSHDVHDRLLDPIQRHVGIIDTGAGNYDQSGLELQGSTLQYDNVYFVSPDGSGNGTAGNAMSLSQSSLDAAYAQNPDGTRIYVQGGNNATYTVNGTTATQTTNLDSNSDLGLYAHPDQDFYGRSADYTQPASSSTQPQINVASGYNGFILQGGENTFSDLSLSGPSSGNTTGIIAYNTSGDETLNILNTEVSQFRTGVFAQNSSTGTMTINATDSQFNDNTSSGSGAQTVLGMNLQNTSSGDLTLNATDSQFNSNNVTDTGVTLSKAYGLSAQNSGTGTMTINATDSQFNSNTATGNNTEASGANIVNSSTGNTVFTTQNSQFNSNTAADGTSLAEGAYIENSGNGSMTMTATNSQFNNNSAADQAMGLEAVLAGSSGALSIYTINSQFNNNSADVLASGFSAINLSSAPGATLTIDNNGSQFNNNTADTGYGLFVSKLFTSPGTVVINNTNTTATGNTTDDYFYH